MKYTLFILVACFLNFCSSKESNFEQKRKSELLLLYLKENQKSKLGTCQDSLSKSLSCLNQSKNTKNMTENQLSEKLSKDFKFSKNAQNYSELCLSYSSNFMKNQSKISQICTFECQRDFWNRQSCKDSEYEDLYKNGFLILELDTKTCIQNCFSYSNTKIKNQNLKNLSTEDFFRLINKQ